MRLQVSSSDFPKNIDFLDFVEGELDARLTAEDRHEAAQAVLVVHDLLDAAVEVGEGTFLDADGFAGFEDDLRTSLLVVLAHARLDFGDLVVCEGNRMVVAEELDHARRVVHQVPALLGHHHLDEHVARIHAAFGLVLGAVADFFDLLDGKQHFAELILQVGAFNALDDGLLHALFHRGIHVQRVPAHLLALRVGRRGSLTFGLLFGFGHNCLLLARTGRFSGPAGGVREKLDSWKRPAGLCARHRCRP